MQWGMVAGGNLSQWPVVYALGRYTVCSAGRRSIIAPWEIYHLLPACLCMAVCLNLAVSVCECVWTLSLVLVPVS